MNSFSTFFELGIRHIVDFNGLDHLLFIVALVAAYQLVDMKRMLILITAFTIGHSLTLILASTGMVSMDRDWIEFLIPLTILVTALSNIWRGKSAARSRVFFPLTITVIFGLVHGFGFSNYLKIILSKNASQAMPILAFNLGIELGQILIVAAVLVISAIGSRIFHFSHRDWILVVSGIAAGAAMILLKAAIFW